MQSEYEIANNFQEVEIKYIKLLAKQIKEIGKMSPANLNRFKILLKAGANIRELNKELKKATNMSQKQLNAVYKASGISIFELAREHFALPKTFTYVGLVQGIANSTLKDLINISNTTSIQKQYIKAIDKAVQEISLGISQPEQVIRSILKEEANSGIKVRYKSGLTRRLDTAVRMNVKGGMNRLHAELQDKIGEEYGADGIEVSAHALCAPDHLFIQGRQFTKEQFKKIDESLHRPIGEYNCYHYTINIKMGDTPAYTEEQLAELNRLATEKVVIDGKERTRYEVSQMMRNLEYRMRLKKEQYIAFREVGDTEQMRMCKNDLKRIRNKYSEIAKIAGLEEELWRAYVPDFIRR